MKKLTLTMVAALVSVLGGGTAYAAYDNCAYIPKLAGQNLDTSYDIPSFPDQHFPQRKLHVISADSPKNALFDLNVGIVPGLFKPRTIDLKTLVKNCVDQGPEGNLSGTLTYNTRNIPLNPSKSYIVAPNASNDMYGIIKLVTDEAVPLSITAYIDGGS